MRSSVVVVAITLLAGAAAAEEVRTARTQLVASPADDDAPATGPRTALVTAELFCNYAHVQCATAERLLRRVRDRHPESLRIVYRQVVLQFRDSQVVAEGTMEAFAQGRFFELADAAVSRGVQLRQRDFEAVADRAGVDMTALRAALEDHRHLRRLQEDATRRELLGVGAQLGVAWNGEASSDLSLDAMEKCFSRAQELATRRLAEGVSRDQLHATLVREAMNARARATAEAGRRRGDDAPRSKVAAGKSPTRGADDAAVTIVVFTDFECSFCRRQEELFDRLLALYPDRLRVVYKHFPMAQHGGARAAAEAAECARLQGRFWSMHQALFAAGGRVRGADLERVANDAGLDVGRLAADLAAGSCVAGVDADLAQGQALGVESTPTLFVNGIKLVGLRNLPELRALIEDESAPGVVSRILGR